SDDVSAEKDLHPSDKGASALIGQQPIQPLVLRTMRNVWNKLAIEAHADGGDFVFGAQRRERAVVEAAAVTQAPSVLVAGKQRHEQRLGLNRLAFGRRLKRAEHAGLQ